MLINAKYNFIQKNILPNFYILLMLYKKTNAPKLSAQGWVKWGLGQRIRVESVSAHGNGFETG